MSDTQSKSQLSRWVSYYEGVKERIHVDAGFFQSAVSVSKIYLYFTGRKIAGLFKPAAARKSIAFFPQPVGPWYNIWMTTQILDMKITVDENGADYIFAFDDLTQTDSALQLSERNLEKAINHRVRDIGKNYVGNVFKSVFGYSVSVDPTKHIGPVVCKSDLNGTHDGVIIECPIMPEQVLGDHAYQRLIDSTFNGKTAEDLRIAYAFGKIAVVFHKHKSLDARFGTTYLSTDIRIAEEVFSNQEIKSICDFCAKMGLDYGAVDIMRDKHDGRIYIVDVNKTCMPVLSLKLKNQLDAQMRVAAAFQAGLVRIDYAVDTPALFTGG